MPGANAVSKTPCPKCGYENRVGASHCNRCGEVFARGLSPGVLKAKAARRVRRRTTFVEQIKANRRASTWLGVLMTLLLATVGCFVGWAIEIQTTGTYEPAVAGLLPLSALAGIAAAVAFSAVGTAFSYLAGDKVVLGVSQARKDPLVERQLNNVVEELCVAAGGLPKPRVMVIEDSAPNAFATGRDPAHATVAITRGLLEKLNRDELQAVMAHEMSHVRNRDILFAMLMAVMVGSVLLLSDTVLRGGLFGGRERRRSRSGEKKGGAELIVLVVVVVLAIVAPILAKLLQFAISREREYLADAGAVDLCRNPRALAGALSKIAGDKEVLEAANRATAHLYIVNPFKPFEDRYDTFFSTHPPIEERIAILEAMGA